MHLNGAINSVFIMSLTKENLIDAHEQGLIINTKNGNIKIVAILNDIYGVNHFNSNQVKWWMFENFERNQATIEQPKPKYNGRAVKCDTYQQLEWFCKHKNYNYTESRLIEVLNDYKNNIGIEKNIVASDSYAKELNYEIISFSQYCTENGITEPKWIQGFEVGKDYNDVVMVSDDNYGWYSRILKSIANNRFIDNNGNAWMFARYPKKGEINEIKFIKMIEDYKLEIGIIDNFAKDNLPALVVKYNLNKHNQTDFVKTLRIIALNDVSNIRTNPILHELMPDLFEHHLQYYNQYTFDEIKNLILKVAKND